jgi:hypothetical protein
MSKLFDSLYSDAPGMQFETLGEFFSGDVPPQRSLLDSVGLSQEELKPFSAALLSEIEHEDSIKRLIRGLTSYSQFQDILSYSVDLEKDPCVQYNRHYCYYESLVYLRESVRSWLDGNILGALVLLRPFAELSLLDAYWNLKFDSGAEEEFHRWFNTGNGKPHPFGNLVKLLLSNLPGAECASDEKKKIVTSVLLNFWRAWSAFNHTPLVKESTVTQNRGTERLSWDSIFLYVFQLDMLLQQLIYIYVMAYPLSLFPVDVYRKFGFSGPVGVFFDPNNGAHLSSYLGGTNWNKMRSEFILIEDVVKALDWFEKLPSKSDQEILLTIPLSIEKLADPTVAVSIGRSIAQKKCEMRAFGWWFNYYHLSGTESDPPDDVVHSISDRIRNWY